MKKFILFHFISLLWLSGFAEKHALIIALGTYNKETGWTNISSKNDVQIIKESLLARGFKEKNIHVYIDGLNKDGILNAIRKDLIGQVKPNDVAYFHFSGHGQQIADDNNDETDGLDEALVPVDAPARNYIITQNGKERYNGEKHLRDDELGAILSELRTILGPNGNLMVTIDACHSGTSTRGIGIARGSKDPIVPDGWQAPQNTSRGINKETGFGLQKDEANMAPMICIFGSSQDELNYEYHPTPEIGYGSLSFAVSKALNEADNKTSYRALVENIRTIMAAIAPRQTPQFEGSIDRQILGGQMLSKPQYLSVINWTDEKHVEVNAGILLSLHPGSIVAFYPPDTRNTSNTKPLATGKVISSRMSDAKVELTEGSLQKEAALSSWCYIRGKNFGDKALIVKLSASNDAYGNAFKNFIMNYTTSVEFSDNSAHSLLVEIGTVEGKSSNEIRITSHDNNIIFSETLKINAGSIENTQLTAAAGAMLKYAQADFLRKINQENPELLAEVTIVPLKLREGGNPRIPSDFEELDPNTLKDANGINIIENTYVRFKIKNNSSRTIYYTLIDIFPDNNLSILYPARGRVAEEYKIQGFGTANNMDKVFKIGPPYGIDMLKLIVSTKPLDFSSIAQSRGAAQSRGTGSPIETLFKNSYRNHGSRGPHDQEVEIEEIGIYNMIYKILPIPN